MQLGLTIWPSAHHEIKKISMLVELLPRKLVREMKWHISHQLFHSSQLFLLEKQMQYLEGQHQHWLYKDDSCTPNTPKNGRPGLQEGTESQMLLNCHTIPERAHSDFLIKETNKCFQLRSMKQVSIKYVMIMTSGFIFVRQFLVSFYFIVKLDIPFVYSIAFN